MNRTINANQIKALFIDFLLDEKLENDIIGSEVMFADKKALADLVLLSNGFINAFEIKAINDDYRKIDCQLEAYNKVFDYVTLITTENHLAKALRLIPQENGIIIVNNTHSFEIFRKPILNSKLNKEAILSTMTIKFLIEYFHIKKRNFQAQEIRKSLSQRNIIEVKSAMYTFLQNRIAKKYLNFILERGTKTHYEDIALLSQTSKRIIL